MELPASVDKLIKQVLIYLFFVCLEQFAEIQLIQLISQLLEDEVFLFFQEIAKEEGTENQSPKVGLLDLYRTPRMRRTSFLLYVLWFCVYIVYYGLVLNLSNLGGNVYINSVISGKLNFGFHFSKAYEYKNIFALAKINKFLLKVLIIKLFIFKIIFNCEMY